MSVNFDFLRNFNNNLHYLAGIIKDEVYKSHSAVLTDATTFLEILFTKLLKNMIYQLNHFHFLKC